MFKTIRSKIAAISISMLLVLGIVISVFICIYLKNSKSLVIQSCYYNIAVFAQDINKEVLKIEGSAKELSLIGEGYEEKRGGKNVLEQATVKVFENSQDTLGGGIWFNPYYILPYKKLFCVYAFRNKNNKVVTDDEFETEEYNYPNQKWYKEIKAGIKSRHDVIWTTPYYEKEGSKTIMLTAGSGIFKESEVVGISTADWDITSIVDKIRNMRPTENSFALFGDVKNDCIIVTTDPHLDGLELLGQPLNKIPWYNTNLKNITYMDYAGKTYIPYVKNLDNGMVFIVCVPEDELFHFIFLHTAGLLFALILVCVMISVLLYAVLKNNVQKPIDKLIAIANKISNGEIDERFEIKNPEEFSKLASTFDKMTQDIRNITKEQQRINSELSIAQKIQYATLPTIFPPYPDKTEFDIYASMDAAKEVGGDFYDFYFIDNDLLMVLVADVSGKGVPAALFMMTVKTIISNTAQDNIKIEDLAKEINRKVYENNKNGFFVTALIGIINTKTGELVFINCGHNPPLIKRKDEKSEYIKVESNIVLGLFDNAKFEMNKTYLSKGDILLMYTDGATEAMNEKEELYGDTRLKNSLDNVKSNDVKNLVDEIKSEIYNFMDNMPQSDDITFLTLKYKGSTDMTAYEAIAEVSSYGNLLKYMNEFCEKEQLDMKISQKLELVIEEIFTNICSYAYPDSKGNVRIEMLNKDGKITVRFEDWGIKYNPLEKEDPDINLSTDKRPIGGLGIFMVKNAVQNIEYEYKDNKNILTLTLEI